MSQFHSSHLASTEGFLNFVDQFMVLYNKFLRYNYSILDNFHLDTLYIYIPKLSYIYNPSLPPTFH
jgi:hypothetical protein